MTGLLLPGVGVAQYVIRILPVTGGGGASAGGNYHVSGTLGQSDAGPVLGGGDYAVLGGNWASSLIEPETTPTLTIERVGVSQVRISWAAGTSSWILQESTSLNPVQWIDTTIVTEAPFTIPVGEATRFYRVIRSP